MAALALDSGNHSEGFRLLQESAAMHRVTGDPWALAAPLNALSRASLAAGDLETAGRCAREALAVTIQAGHTTMSVESLANLAAVHFQQKAYAAALEMALRVLAHPASTQDAKDRAEKLRLDLEPQLTSQQIEEARARAQSLTVDTIAQELWKE